MKRSSKKRLLINVVCCMLMLFAVIGIKPLSAYAATQISSIRVWIEKNDEGRTKVPDIKVETKGCQIVADSTNWERPIAECKPLDKVKVSIRLTTDEGYVFKDTLKKSNFKIENATYSKHQYDSDGNITLTFIYQVYGKADAPEEVYWDDNHPGRIRWSKVSNNVNYEVYICKGSSSHFVKETKETYCDLSDELASDTYFKKDVYVKVRAIPKEAYKNFLKKSDYTESEEFTRWRKIRDKMSKNDGWQLANGVWYYIERNEYVRNQFKDIKNQTYYFFDDGRMATGWQKLHGKWYLFTNNGEMLKNQWYFNGSCWYYLQNDGVMKTGWFDEAGKKYYLVYPTGEMLTNWQCIDGTWYYFYSDGNMARDYFVPSADGMFMYYIMHDGRLQTGWVYQNGWKYVDPKGGYVYKGWLNDNGKTYYLRPEDGNCVTGPTQIDGIWYNFDNTGAKI